MVRLHFVKQILIVMQDRESALNYGTADAETISAMKRFALPPPLLQRQIKWNGLLLEDELERGRDRERVINEALQDTGVLSSYNTKKNLI